MVVWTQRMTPNIRATDPIPSHVHCRCPGATPLHAIRRPARMRRPASANDYQGNIWLLIDGTPHVPMLPFRKVQPSGGKARRARSQRPK
jgi:hypothetical protein